LGLGVFVEAVPASRAHRPPHIVVGRPGHGAVSSTLTVSVAGLARPCYRAYAHFRFPRGASFLRSVLCGFSPFAITELSLAFGYSLPSVPGCAWPGYCCCVPVPAVCWALHCSCWAPGRGFYCPVFPLAPVPLLFCSAALTRAIFADSVLGCCLLTSPPEVPPAGFGPHPDLRPV